MYRVDIKDREMVNMVASNYLCEPENGEDYFDTYVRLVEAIKKDRGILVRSIDDVYVTESVENFLATEITELIEGSVNQYKKHISMHESGGCEVIDNIDWSELRKQKKSLITVFSVLDDESDLAKDLTGLLHLIDGLQDYAVDTLGEDESDVFDLKDED